jgi:hypothetical protein
MPGQDIKKFIIEDNTKPFKKNVPFINEMIH